MAQANKLRLFSQTEYEERAPRGYPVSCPTLDLSASWDGAAKNLFVYRPPGQVVSKIHQARAAGEKPPEALTVAWKPDGQFLAVGWSDGFVRLMGLENNKAAHHINVCGQSDDTITHIGWACNSIVDKIERPGPVWESTLGGNGAPVDLPQDMTFFEIDTALPKISPLPSASAGAGEDAMVFTLRTGIEFLFHPPSPQEYNQVNVMVVGTSHGQLQLSIYDSFIIGSFPCPPSGPSGPLQLVHHASSYQVSTHALLLADRTEEPQEVHLVPMDLPFISSSPINLCLLASKLTTLQKLLRYIKQTQLHMQVEWKNTRELPTRFLRSIEADLEGMPSGPKSIVPALFHTVLTGHAYEPVREWLVDNLAERGHKRWDKAVVSGLQALRSLVHENFLPALDRCTIILSRLRGLALFHDTEDDVGFSVTQIDRVLDIVSCLHLIGHKILANVMDELEYFNAFSIWMRFQIDRLASTTSASEELTEKEATMDYSKILTYIECYLTKSRLSIFFGEMTKEDYTADWEHIEDGPSLPDILDEQLKKLEAGKPAMNALPHVDFLVSYVTTWSNRIFKGVAEAKKRSVRFGKPITLSLGRPIAGMDMKMCEETRAKGAKIFTALTAKDAENRVYLFSCRLEMINGISSNHPPSCCCIDLGSRKLIDFKFLNPETLIILCSEPDGIPKVFRVQTQSDALPYADFNIGSPKGISEVSIDESPVFSFPGGQTTKPLRMEVSERSDVRGEIPARICLLDSKRTVLRTFVIPS